jgi:hypothetical protein
MVTGFPINNKKSPINYPAAVRNAPCGDFKAAAVAAEDLAEPQAIDHFASLHPRGQSI